MVWHLCVARMVCWKYGRLIPGDTTLGALDVTVGHCLTNLFGTFKKESVHMH